MVVWLPNGFSRTLKISSGELYVKRYRSPATFSARLSRSWHFFTSLDPVDSLILAFICSSLVGCQQTLVELWLWTSSLQLPGEGAFLQCLFLPLLLWWRWPFASSSLRWPLKLLCSAEGAQLFQFWCAFLLWAPTCPSESAWTHLPPEVHLAGWRRPQHSCTQLLRLVKQQALCLHIYAIVLLELAV